MDRLRIGLVGYGYWGPNLVRNFSTCPLTEVVAVCDAGPARPERTTGRYGSYADHGVSSAPSAVKVSPCSILLGSHAPAVDAGCLFT